MGYTRTKEQLTVAPAIEPVSVGEAAYACRIFGHDEDAWLATEITSARKRLEKLCWSSFITQTWDFWWDRFWWKMFIPYGPIYPRNSVSAVSVFEYRISVGPWPWTPVPSTIWELSEERELPFARLQYLQTWPITRGYRDDIHIQVQLGYGPNPSDVPEPIREMILLMVANRYMNRGDVAGDLPIPERAWNLVTDYRFKEF